MTSADFLQFVVTMLRFECVYSFTPARPPLVSVITFTSYICCIYTMKFGQYWTSFWLGNSSVSKCLICNFCSSDRGFASDFFQTPPHDGRPCLWLTVPTAKPVADFHRQVITHAEHTSKKARQPFIYKGFRAFFFGRGRRTWKKCPLFYVVFGGAFARFWG